MAFEFKSCISARRSLIASSLPGFAFTTLSHLPSAWVIWVWRCAIFSVRLTSAVETLASAPILFTFREALDFEESAASPVATAMAPVPWRARAASMSSAAAIALCASSSRSAAAACGGQRIANARTHVNMRQTRLEHELTFRYLPRTSLRMRPLFEGIPEKPNMSKHESNTS
eukprot:9487281-Pyramimonas_sp.AAC.3